MVPCVSLCQQLCWQQDNGCNMLLGLGMAQLQALKTSGSCSMPTYEVWACRQIDLQHKGRLPAQSELAAQGRPVLRPWCCAT